MKICLPFLLLAASLLGISAGLARQEDRATAQPLHEKASVYLELLKVPEKARAEPNPCEGDPDAVAAGRKLFQRYCAECHGSAAEGRKKSPEPGCP